MLRVHAGPPALVGRFDRARVERAVENLLSNAFKYSPGGGEVFVRVREDHRADGRWAVVELSDHGIGIPADQRGQVFHRFVRARNAVEAGIRGSGIGLCGVRQTVEQHGGRVGAASEEGRGSTVTLRLPLAAA